MKISQVKNEKGEVLKTQDGIELQEFKFEKGDEFVPSYNTILVKEYEAEEEIKGKKQKVKRYINKIKAKVRDAEKNIVKDNQGNKEVFVLLTPSQAKSLQKKIDNGDEINQKLFTAYEYESSIGTQEVGIGYKGEHKPAKDFDDFDNPEVEETEEQ